MLEGYSVLGEMRASSGIKKCMRMLHISHMSFFRVRAFACGRGLKTQAAASASKAAYLPVPGGLELLPSGTPAGSARPSLSPNCSAHPSPSDGGESPATLSEEGGLRVRVSY